MYELLSFVFVIGVLVFIHELGHFIAARLTGMRADVFSIGMGPRLVGWNRQTGFTFGKLSEDVDLGPDTDYRLCALPIGGYVRILGMVDESLDTEFADQPPKPYEFRSKKNWQKAFVLSAGVIMNLLFAIIVFAGMLFVLGTSVPHTTTAAWVEPGMSAHEAGLRSGDSIVSINGASVGDWQEIREALVAGSGSHVVEVRRENQSIKLTMTSDDIVRDISAGGDLGFEIGTSVYTKAVVSGMPAEKAGLLVNDTLLLLDSAHVQAIGQTRSIIRSKAGRSVELTFKRGDKVLTKQLAVTSDGTIGVELGSQFSGPMHKRTYNVFEATAGGIEGVGSTMALIWQTLGKVFRGIVAPDKALGGPLTIAKQAASSARAGGAAFLGFMALISVSLAFMNLLPLPGLDGGHLFIVGVESVIRRELSTNVKIRIQQVGVFFLLTLMAGIIFMEIRKFYFN